MAEAWSMANTIKTKTLRQTMEIDFSDKIKERLPYGFEEEISNESWGAEKKKGKKLNKPFRTSKGPKKFSVYVKNDKGNIVKVNFGDPNMEIKRDDPARRKSFRARHDCENPGPKWKARYWSCRQWRAGTKVEGSHEGEECEAQTMEISPTEEETHEQFMSRCEETGNSKEDCMKYHEGHEFQESKSKDGLWDNIRKKKKRMGDNYRPAKTGDKDRPSKQSWKKAQKKKD
tara:strand:+ start:12 stop:701 length:690 start_codon:yes stop_codon:yes gene_type:complete